MSVFKLELSQLVFIKRSADEISGDDHSDSSASESSEGYPDPGSSPEDPNKGKKVSEDTTKPTPSDRLTNLKTNTELPFDPDLDKSKPSRPNASDAIILHNDLRICKDLQARGVMDQMDRFGLASLDPKDIKIIVEQRKTYPDFMDNNPDFSSDSESSVVQDETSSQKLAGLTLYIEREIKTLPPEMSISDISSEAMVESGVSRRKPREPYHPSSLSKELDQSSPDKVDQTSDTPSTKRVKTSHDEAIGSQASTAKPEEGGPSTSPAKPGTPMDFIIEKMESEMPGPGDDGE